MAERSFAQTIPAKPIAYINSLFINQINSLQSITDIVHNMIAFRSVLPRSGTIVDTKWTPNLGLEVRCRQ